jgi:hypothetical protein
MSKSLLWQERMLLSNGRLEGKRAFIMLATFGIKGDVFMWRKSRSGEDGPWTICPSRSIPAILL